MWSEWWAKSVLARWEIGWVLVVALAATFGKLHDVRTDRALEVLAALRARA